MYKTLKCRQVSCASLMMVSNARRNEEVNLPQTWNNCRPATIAEVLAYWGIARTQAEVRAALRVDGPKAGMTPYGIPTYARSLGLRAPTRPRRAG